MSATSEDAAETLPTFPTRDLRWDPAERERYSRLDHLWLKVLRDERDLIFARHVTRMSLHCLVATAALFAAPSWLVWPLGLLHLGILVPRYMGPFTLMLHATAHRPLFKRRHTLLQWYIPAVLGAFFGQTPTAFYAHHLSMHHPEQGALGDESTTLCYRRDSFRHWLRYWARFFFAGLLHLSRYLRRTGKDRVRRRLLIGEASWFVAVAALAVVSWQATVLLFVIPLVLIRVLMMSGNWAQHAFIDVDDPENPYRASTTLINHRYNHNCYNDGYHVVHHLSPGLHWSEMPAHLDKHLDKYAANDALIFDGLGNNQVVWWCLMTGDYARLEAHLVRHPGDERSAEERIAMLKARARGTLERSRGA